LDIGAGYSSGSGGCTEDSFGLLGTPIAYAFQIRKIGVHKALVPAVVATLTGGFAGALAEPPMTALTGITGFFIGLAWATSRRTSWMHRIARHPRLCLLL